MEDDNRRYSPRGGSDFRNRQARYYPGGQRQDYQAAGDEWDDESPSARDRYGSAGGRRDWNVEAHSREPRHASRQDRPGRDDSWRSEPDADPDRNIIDRVVREVRSWFNDDDQNYGRGHERNLGRNYGRNYPDYGSDQARAWTGRDRDYGQERDPGEDRYGGASSYRGAGRDRSHPFGEQDRQEASSRQAGYSPGGTSFVYSEFWLVPGPHRGVGPKGYRRSKERIKEEICERLQQHGRIDASDIEIDVEDEGEVRLSGTVERRDIKRLAEDVAESVSGVHDVQNQIRVQRREDSGRDFSGSDPSRHDESSYQEGLTGSTARTEQAAQKQTRTDH